MQNKRFQDVFKAIRKSQKNELKTQLGLYIDEDDLLRCQGRLNFMNMNQDSILPKLLPRNEHFTELVIKDRHEKTYHSGVSHTLSKIRSEF